MHIKQSSVSHSQCSQGLTSMFLSLLSQTLSVFLDPNVPRPFIPKSQLYAPRPFVPRHYTPYLPGPFIQKVYPQIWQICSFSLYSTAPMLPGWNVLLVTLDLGIKGLTPTLEKSPHCNNKIRHGRCKIFPL